MIPLRSTVALMPRAAVVAWYGYTATPRIQIASKAARSSCVAAHVTHVKTGEKELHGSAGKQSGAVRGPLCLSGQPIGSLCSPEYRLAVSCRVNRPVSSAGRRQRKNPHCLLVDCAQLLASPRGRRRSETKSAHSPPCTECGDLSSEVRPWPPRSGSCAQTRECAN